MIPRPKATTNSFSGSNLKCEIEAWASVVSDMDTFYVAFLEVIGVWIGAFGFLGLEGWLFRDYSLGFFFRVYRVYKH